MSSESEPAEKNLASAARKRPVAGAEPETRAAILTAALEILRSNGHQALTVRAVATRAGCSTIGVYTWFGGKDGLVDALLIDGYRSFAEALANAKRRKGSLGQLLGQGWAYRTWALAHPTQYRVMFMDAVPGHVPGQAARTEGAAAYILLRNEVEAARKRGELHHDDADAVALVVWGAAHGLVSIELTQIEPLSISGALGLHDRSFALAMETLLRGLTS
jgi:AcrR family transcriptional regulator